MIKGAKYLLTLISYKLMQKPKGDLTNEK